MSLQVGKAKYRYMHTYTSLVSCMPLPFIPMYLAPATCINDSSKCVNKKKKKSFNRSCFVFGCILGFTLHKDHIAEMVYFSTLPARVGMGQGTCTIAPAENRIHSCLCLSKSLFASVFIPKMSIISQPCRFQ